MVFPLGMFHAGYGAQKWPEMLGFCRRSQLHCLEPLGVVVESRDAMTRTAGCCHQQASSLSLGFYYRKKDQKLPPGTWSSRARGMNPWLTVQYFVWGMRQAGLSMSCVVTRYFVRAGGKMIHPALYFSAPVSYGVLSHSLWLSLISMLHRVSMSNLDSFLAKFVKWRLEVRTIYKLQFWTLKSYSENVLYPSEYHGNLDLEFSFS